MLFLSISTTIQLISCSSLLLLILSISFHPINGDKARESKDYVSAQSIHDKPNIIFIMADDLGWGNVGYHNKENPEVYTPNIDYLVKHGLQLNRHYVDAECSPTRTSFQSGRLPVYGNTNNNDGITDPSMGVHPDMTCIASKLKEAGYSTHMIGKWDSGFASYRQIPIHRGYDTSFGYLGKSIDYFTKKGDGVCTQSYIDLWENDAPAFDAVSDIDLDEYSEYMFTEKVLDKIDEMAALEDNDPFFLFYASHLPHYPSQLPEDCIDEGFYTDFKNDESQCSNGNSQIFPGYYEDKTLWKCRSILQAQVAVLDDIVGQITSKLKENDQWEKTLIFFTSDNGGSLELDETAGNNYPLRGGKASFLEGGIRATAFISGGYLPESRRGDIENGLMHISDWYVTFSSMVGVDYHDYNAVDKGLPDVTGYNMWPLIVGETTDSPRIELVMNKNTFFSGEYKLIIGSSTKYAIWQSAIFPNASSPTQEALEHTYLTCDSKKNWGCLFNVVEDPGEHNDLANELPHLLERMRERLDTLKEDFWESEFNGNNACPDTFAGQAQDYVDVDLSTYGDVDACGCWMSIHNYNFFAGPYQDLTEDQINFDPYINSIDHVDVNNINDMVQGQGTMIDKSNSFLYMFDIENLDDFRSHYLIYIALIVSTTILMVVVIKSYQRTLNGINNKRRNKNKPISNYGAV